MSDNSTISNGDSIAADEIEGVKYQRIKLVLGGDGVNDGDASGGNPIPVTNDELLNAIESLTFAVHALTRSIGMSMPDAAGRLRVLTDASSAIGTVSTVTGVTTVTTVASLTNQAQVGGIAAQDQIAALMRTSADMLRQSTVVTS